MHREFVGSCAGKEFSRPRAAKPARPAGPQGVFVLPVDRDFSLTARCGMNSGGKTRARNAAALIKRGDSTQPRALKMPLVRGERTGVLGKSFPEMFERLEERIDLPAPRRRMLAG